MIDNNVDLSESRDVIGHVPFESQYTVSFHSFDLSGSRDVISHGSRYLSTRTMLFPIGVLLTPTRYLELFSRY